MMSTHPSRVITYRKTEKESVRTRVNQKGVNIHLLIVPGIHHSTASPVIHPRRPAGLLFPVGLGWQQCVTKGLRFLQESGTIKMIKHYNKASETLILSQRKEIPRKDYKPSKSLSVQRSGLLP